MPNSLTYRDDRSCSFQVSIKLRMPRFVGVSSSLENCADGSSIRGLSLVEVLIRPQDTVRVHCAPSRPGRYYLNIYVSPDWRRDDIRELACSFQVSSFVVPSRLSSLLEKRQSKMASSLLNNGPAARPVTTREGGAEALMPLRRSEVKLGTPHRTTC